MSTNVVTAPLVAAASEGTLWLPPQASTIAPGHDFLFYLIYWISVLFFVGLMGAMTFFFFAYRRKTGKERTSPIAGNHTLEIVWSAIPGLILLVFFWLGFTGFVKTLTPPANTLDVRVTGVKWSWSFLYPNGASTTELVVPVNRPVRLIMSSTDVIHSFYVPAFRVKRDVLPNRYTQLWFEATQEGEFNAFCTEYCGTSHSSMITKVKVVSEEKYRDIVENEGKLPDGLTLAQWGEQLYTKQGCNACHSVDGNRLVGPSFKGIWNRDVKTNVGTVKTDDEYIRESLMNPLAKVVDGYPPSMPTYAGRLNDDQIAALIEWMKTSDKLQ